MDKLFGPGTETLKNLVLNSVPDLLLKYQRVTEA